MPVESTPSVTLSEDTAGMLRADVRIAGGGGNQVVLAPAAGAPGSGNPGLFALQLRPAGGEMYQKPGPVGNSIAPQGIFPISGGGAGGLFEIPFYQAELFDTDGIADLNPEMVDAQAAQMNIAVPGYYRAGMHMHIGDPSGSPTSSGGTLTQIAVRVRSASATAGQFVSVASECYIPGQGSWNAISGKWLHLAGTNFKCSGIWPLQRGDTITFGVRNFAGGGWVAAPGASDSFPWIGTAWAYLARPTG